MLPEETQRKLIDEIQLFIEYGVEEKERESALTFVKKYTTNPQALQVLLEFYKVLPQSREEAVCRLARIDSLQGVTVLAISSAAHDYVAVVSESEAYILGEYGKDPLPSDLLNFFGHSNDDEFVKSYGEVAEMDELPSADAESGCPACQVAVGENHLLGCPVEVCPWCEGQLSRCNCRFEKLDVEEMDTEEQVESLKDLLEEKGRIPYRVEQKPGYPGTSGGLDRQGDE